MYISLVKLSYRTSCILHFVCEFIHTQRWSSLGHSITNLMQLNLHIQMFRFHISHHSFTNYGTSGSSVESRKWGGVSMHLADLVSLIRGQPPILPLQMFIV